MDVIHEHLYSPDGVRLMGSPAPYRGGVETFFRRAESAAFFGREIGLQYVHAHIRYAEALAMLGRGKEFYKALMVICPVQLEETVANAAPRQSNHYFSSSDADVLNRADAADRFDDILEGKVAAKGGWRVYSSGPGIYIGLVIRKLLGLRSHADGFTFDPVLPKSLDGLSVAFQICGRSVTIEYQVSEGECGPVEIMCGGVSIEAEREAHPYRCGGLMISENVLESALRTYGDRLVVKM
jgi:CRISPR-associated protein Csx3